MDKNQTGFVPGCGTHLNIKLLTKKIRSYYKRENMTIIFIDLKSAYNTVNRKKLYEIMKKKEILLDTEVDFLEKIHDSIFFKVNGKKYYFNNGVH